MGHTTLLLLCCSLLPARFTQTDTAIFFEPSEHIQHADFPNVISICRNFLKILGRSKPTRGRLAHVGAQCHSSCNASYSSVIVGLTRVQTKRHVSIVCLSNYLCVPNNKVIPPPMQQQTFTLTHFICHPFQKNILYY